MCQEIFYKNFLIYLGLSIEANKRLKSTLCRAEARTLVRAQTHLLRACFCISSESTVIVFFTDVSHHCRKHSQGGKRHNRRRCPA